MSIRRILLILVFLTVRVVSQPAIVTVPDEPSNLDNIKQQLKQYQSCMEAAATRLKLNVRLTWPLAS
jgi:hypothetical protein